MEGGETPWLCIVASSIAGIGSGFFGCVLSYAHKLGQSETGRRYSRFLSVFGVIGSTLFGCGSLVAINYGPIALVTVIRASTILPSNAVFAQLFGLRPLVRDDYLATIAALSGVVCFSIFAASPASSMDATEYLDYITSPPSYVGHGVLLACFFASLFWVAYGQRWFHFADPNTDMLALAAAVSGIGGCSSAFMDVAAKGWTTTLGTDGVWAALKSPLFLVTFLENAIFLVAMRVSMIYGCKHVDVLMFVPMNTVLNIILSVSAGLVILGEWENVTSWMGLIASMFSILGGIAMLVLGPADEQVCGNAKSQGEASTGNSQESLSIPHSLPARAYRGEASVPRQSVSLPCVERRASMLSDASLVFYDISIGSCHTKAVALSQWNWEHWRARDARVRLQSEFRAFCDARRSAGKESGDAPTGPMPSRSSLPGDLDRLGSL